MTSARRTLICSQGNLASTGRTQMRRAKDTNVGKGTRVRIRLNLHRQRGDRVADCGLEGRWFGAGVVGDADRAEPEAQRRHRIEVRLRKTLVHWLSGP